MKVRDGELTVLQTLSESEKAYIPDYLTSIMEQCFFLEPSQRPSFNQIVKRLEHLRPDDYTSAAEEDAGDEKIIEKVQKKRSKSKRAGKKTETIEEEMKPTGYTEMSAV
jgi:hypothetical protein